MRISVTKFAYIKVLGNLEEPLYGMPSSSLIESSEAQISTHSRSCGMVRALDVIEALR